MAKTKDFGGLESNNKNIGNGVNALIKSPLQSKSTAKEEQIKEDDVDLSNYPLRIPRATLKALKTIALDRDTSVKEIIMIALHEKYNI
ncbi:hypothetical protein AAKU52_002334 [Pedobacter sp. CG_S7]|uniref:hypothetical protein n=1 Tax=Pedobacter sp. CG_S7 TaxID=3143930 RepID=UPI003390E16A